MGKYIAVQDRRKFVRIVKTEEATYIPAGWHMPCQGGTMNLRTGHLTHGVFPAEKRKAQVSVQDIIVTSNNARVVDDQTTAELDQIDAEIRALRVKYKAILNDRFLTFRLVEASDLQLGKFAGVYPTKAEATKAF